LGGGTKDNGEKWGVSFFKRNRGRKEKEKEEKKNSQLGKIGREKKREKDIILGGSLSQS
jgi:hypothetical protein